MVMATSTGVGTGSISFTVGASITATANQNTNLRMNSRSASIPISNVRLLVFGGVTYVEVQTVGSTTPFTIACTVVADSSPRAGTGWQFDPTFQQSTGGTTVVTLPVNTDTANGMQWGVTDGNGDAFYLRNRNFIANRPLLMSGQPVRDLAVPSQPNDAVRYTDVRSLRAIVLWASGTLFPSNQHNAVFQFPTIPVEWNGRQVRIDYIVQLSRGSGNILTKSWMRVQGQGENGRLISEFTGTDSGITGSQASISATMVYNIPAGGASNIIMELRNNSSAGNWDFINTTATPSLAIMRLADVT
jgi:hypothetical protein